MCGMCNLSSLTRIRTHNPLHWKRGVLITGQSGKSHSAIVIRNHFNRTLINEIILPTSKTHNVDMTAKPQSKNKLTN